MIAEIILLQQADPGVAQPGAQSSSAVVEMVMNSGPVAMGVLVLLLVASIYSWTIILSKISILNKATKQSKRFLRAFRKATRLNEISSMTSDYAASPLVDVFEDVYDTYKRQTGGAGPPRNLASLERSAQAAASESITSLERRMTWLATIAAVSPFVGLFGTVVGIIDAFHGLGAAGAATLRAVAPGISEALITTAAGLFVAVPAVVAYNQLTAKIRVIASTVDDFIRELLNSLDEIPARQAPSPLAQPKTEAPRENERGLYR